MMIVILLAIFQLPYSLNFPPAATVAAVERAYGKNGSAIATYTNSDGNRK
jgi:hypothetical protein